MTGAQLEPVTITVLTERGVLEVAANQKRGTILIAPDSLRDLLGWELKPEGLCRDDACIPVRDRAELEHGGSVDLIAVASLLGRPSVVDYDARIVAVGLPSSERHGALRDLRVPPLQLLDLSGVAHDSSKWLGTKTLLIAFASW